MQVEIKIDSSYTEPKVIIVTNKMTDEIKSLIDKLSDDKPQLIAGFIEDNVEILEPSKIMRIYSSNSKIFAQTLEKTYILRLRLYELENRLDKSVFVRISNSEIINLKMVKNFDLSFTGTICVTLSGNIVTYVSRRYVTKIKKALGM